MKHEKKSIEMILKQFPMFAERLDNDDQIMTKKDLDQVEKVFYEMCLFFKNPVDCSFDMGLLYKYLQDDWVKFAFECLETFFKNDTFLLSNDYTLILTDKDPLLNQTSFAKCLNDAGIKFDRKKLNVYYERGKLPKVDAMIEGKPYWLESTVQEYIDKFK